MAPGQYWIDLDPRNAGRMIRVASVGRTHAVCETVRTTGGRPPKRPVRPRIRLDRFVAVGRGYRLVAEPGTATT